jgi:hypothetical protein
MSEHYGHFDAVEESPQYTAAQDARFFDLLARDIIPDYLNELEPSMDTGLQTIMDSGGMISRGYFYVQDEDADGASPKTFTHDAESAGSNRKDRIVIEFDTTTGVNAAKISKGTGTAGTPSAPDLVDTETVWEEGVAIVTIAGGAVTAVEDTRIISGARAGNIITGTEDDAPDGYYRVNTLYVQVEAE